MVQGDPSAHLEEALRRIEQKRPLSVLYVAADRPYKNIEMFVRLAKAVAEQYPSIPMRFRLVSNVQRSTARQIECLRPSNLEVVASISDWKSAYEAADILLHPSLEEGYGLPLVEAMQFGIPIISTDIPAIRETVSEGGQLLPANLDQAWVSALTSLIEPNRYRTWARASAEQGRNYTTERFLAQLRVTFPELVSGPQQGLP
jgi:glycosyltransferase involved in cell wall biosynthesis